MAIGEIPVSSANDLFSQVTELDGREYVFKFGWNDRTSAWYVSIYNMDETVAIIEGKKVTVQLDFLGRVSGTDRPPGRIFCLDVSGGSTNPDRDGFGVTHKMYYANP